MYINWMTLCSRILREKLIVARLVKKLATSYGTPKVYYHFLRLFPLVSVRSQTNPVFVSGPGGTPWPYFCSFQDHLRVLICDLRFDKRRRPHFRTHTLSWNEQKYNPSSFTYDTFNINYQRSSLPCVSFLQTFIWIIHLFHACYMFDPFYSSWYGHSNMIIR
jgi:hypothetical protein